VFNDLREPLLAYGRKHPQDEPLVRSTLLMRFQQLDFITTRVETLYEADLDAFQPEHERAVELSSAELVLYTEAFYNTAWQVVQEVRLTEVPGRKCLFTTQAALVRNWIMVHVERGFDKRPAYSVAFLPKHSDVCLQFQSWPDDEGERMIDRGLKHNANEFHDVLLSLFS
jgi:hypothetical protein